MSKRYTLKRSHMIAISLVAIIILLLGYYRYGFTFKSPSDPELLQSNIASPDQRYTATSYGIPYGGAAGGVMLQVEVTDTRTSDSKIIYRARAKTTTQLKWLSDNTLQITNESPEYGINYNTELKVNTDIYEQSGSACRSIPLKLSSYYERCYQAES